MPLPFLIAGAAALLGMGGIGAHLSAKDVNKQADDLINSSKDRYNNYKNQLERAKEKTANRILDFENNKKIILQSTMTDFVNAFDKIKHIQLKDNTGISELSKFVIERNEIVDVQRLNTEYKAFDKNTVIASVAGGVAGAATLGAIKGVSTLGIGLSSAAISFAAPIVLFTGISASMKADKRLEEAKVLVAKVDASVEEIQTLITKCHAVEDWADMYIMLLDKMNSLFSESTRKMAAVIKKRQGLFKFKKINPKKITEDDMSLFAVTRALAGAVKSIIDIPILNSNGDIDNESTEKYETMNDDIPMFEESVENLRSCNY